jgi:hypothetical protein
MRRLRLRLWQIMIAVVLLATLAFAERMRRQRAICLVRAIHYASLQKEADGYFSNCKYVLTDNQRRLERARKTLRDCDQPYLRKYFESKVRQEEGRVADSEEIVRTAERRLERLSRLRLRWEQAAARPWLYVPPEPYSNGAGESSGTTRSLPL